MNTLFGHTAEMIEAVRPRTRTPLERQQEAEREFLEILRSKPDMATTVDRLKLTEILQSVLATADAALQPRGELQLHNHQSFGRRHAAFFRILAMEVVDACRRAKDPLKIYGMVREKASELGLTLSHPLEYEPA